MSECVNMKENGIQRKLLCFSDYVFLESEYPTCLKEELKQHENIVQVLGEKNEFISIS